MIDQRQTGMTKVGMTDKNGKRAEIYSINVAKIRAWIGLIMAIAMLVTTVVTGVWAGVRFGVAAEINSAIKATAVDEDGIIHQQIHECTEQYLDVVQTNISLDLEKMEGELTEQRELGIRLEISQENMETKITEWTGRVESNHEEVMLWLRTLADGDSP